MVSYKKIREFLDYNPETGIVRWKKHRSKHRIGKKVGTPRYHPKTKVIECYTVAIEGEAYYLHRVIWLWYHGEWPKGVIDHIDRDGTHNWISNLRDTNKSMNMRNSGNPVNNTSGVKGVYWDNLWEAWVASVKTKKGRLGRFKDFDEAVCHRLAGEQCIGGHLNSPAYLYVRDKIQKKLVLNRRKKKE